MALTRPRLALPAAQAAREDMRSPIAATGAPERLQLERPEVYAIKSFTTNGAQTIR